MDWLTSLFGGAAGAAGGALGNIGSTGLDLSMLSESLAGLTPEMYASLDFSDVAAGAMGAATPGAFDYMSNMASGLGKGAMNMAGDSNFNNMANLGIQGYNAYGAHQNQKDIMGIAKRNQAMTEDSYARSTEREDRLRDLDFTAGA